MPTTRITQNISYRDALSNLQRNYSDLSHYQSQLSSNRRISRPSDDPSGTARLLGIRRLQRDLEQFGGNISEAQTSIDATSRELGSFASAFQDAKAHVIAGLNGTLDDSGRAIAANALDSLISQMLTAANAKIDDRFLFAGSRTDTAPFVRSIGADGLERVLYHGDDQENTLSVGPSLETAQNIPGSRLLGGGTRAATTFSGTTGAARGSGTDSGTGRARLLVAHSTTSFGTPSSPTSAHASGLRLGASSAAGDTILGSGHSLALTVNAGGGGTVTLDGGTAVTFTTGDTNLAVTGPNGQKVYLDFSGATTAFSGAVTLTATGTLSLDGGTTTTPIDFTSGGQGIINSIDGSVTHVDSRNITQAGTDDVSYSGTFDVFSSLIAIRDALRTTGTAARIDAALGQARQRLGDLEDAEDFVLAATSQAAGTSTRLSSLSDSLADMRIDLASRRSNVEDVDLADVMINMKEQEAVYQASLIVTSRLNSISLLNFIR